MLPGSSPLTSRVKAKQNILIIGVNWLGDACMSMPALQLFRERNPNTHITMLTRPALTPLWDMHPSVDDTIPMHPTLGEMRRAAKELRKRNIDKAYVFPNSWRSALVPFFAGIPIRLGQSGHHRRMLLTDTTPLSPQTKERHQQWEYVDVLQLQGVATLPSPILEIPTSITKQMQERMPTESDSPWVGILPGAARGPSKQWPEDRYIETAKMIAAKTSCRFALMGTSAEAELCNSIAEAIGENATSLAGKTTLAELISALGQCHTVLCNDSGGMHLAASAGTPVIAIYGITDPDKTGPLGSAHKLICAEGVTASRDIPRDSTLARDALKSIVPERVADAALNTLKTRTSAP
jgi:heptosyltransferase-2